MKRFTPLLLALGMLLALASLGRAQAEQQANRDAEELAIIGEEHGGIASYKRTSPDCFYLLDDTVYVCPEPLPAVLPTQDPAVHAQALKMLGEAGLLLIPDSTNRRVMAFDPVTGDVADENFIPPDPANLNLPFNAILSAAGDTILVSSYNEDLIQEYDLMGNYLGFFAPSTGPDPVILDTPRGIELRQNGNLLVASSLNPELDIVAEFDTDGVYLGPFISDGAGGLNSPYDLFGRTSDWLVAGAASDAIHRYDLSGTYLENLTPIDNFPQQINGTISGNLLVANFSGAQKGVLEMSPTGIVEANFNPLDNGQRGVYELPNGNILTTSGTSTGAVYEIERVTGAIVDTKISGLTPRYIEYVQTEETVVAIILEKTVGTTPGECAVDDAVSVGVGAEVTYCFTVTNAGNVTFTSHDLYDDMLGPILDDFALELAPGESTYVTRSTTITQTTINSAEWTATNGAETASDSDTATVNVLPTSITLAKGVGVDPGECPAEESMTVAAGTEVVYCYRVTNTGDVTFTNHDLTDDVLGIILDDFAYTLAPGASTFVTRSTVLLESTVNSAEWIARDGPVSASAQNSATVTVLDASINLLKTVGDLPDICAATSAITVTAGTEVTYCYTVTNTGEITLTSHNLIDSELGLLLSGYPFSLAPGESTSYMTSAVINDTTTNIATWTSFPDAGLPAEASATASVTVQWPLYLPIMQNDQ